MTFVGMCAVVSGTIQIHNSPYFYGELDTALVLGFVETVFGVLLIDHVCRPALARLLRPLVTRKRMIISAVLVVLLSGVWWLENRSSAFRETERLHSESEQSSENMLASIKKGEVTKQCIYQDDGLVALVSAEGLIPIYQRSVAYHQAMKTKYHRAAHYPWLPVSPDPPKPE